MSDVTLQFGPFPPGPWTERPSAYAVVFNNEGLILALKVDGEYHLPGGGIDPSEDPEAAVIRESLEEACCTIENLELIGRANQFILDAPQGFMNKTGIFYKAKMVTADNTLSIDETHEPVWIEPYQFCIENAPEFQHWAVQECVN